MGTDTPTGSKRKALKVLEESKANMDAMPDWTPRYQGKVCCVNCEHRIEQNRLNPRGRCKVSPATPPLNYEFVPEEFELCANVNTTGECAEYQPKGGQ